MAQEKLSSKLLKTAGRTFNCGLDAVGDDAISILSVSLAFFSIADSAFGIRGLTRPGSRGERTEDIAGPALTR